MTKPRDGLLPRMETRTWADGKTVSYRFHPVAGKPTKWTTDYAAAVREVLDLTGRRDDFGTMRWLWQQWQTGRRWKRLAAGTQADYALAWKQIDARLGHMAAAAVTAPMIARYVHVERQDSPRRADIERAVMSNLFKHGITLGVCTINPTTGVEASGHDVVRKLPDGDVLRKYLAWLDQRTPQQRVIGQMAEFAALTGCRRVEFLDICKPQVDRAAGVLRIKRAKQRGAKRGEVVERVAITPRLEALLLRIDALGHDSLYLFPTRDGNAYTDRGFKSLWQRCMRDAMAAGIVPVDARFNFHALRRWFTTEHKALYGSLPDLHADPSVTAGTYDATRVVDRRSL